MDEKYRFILNKLEFGLKSEHINQPLSETDRQRLFMSGNNYMKIPEHERNEWSRKTHHALQMTFLTETSDLDNLSALEEWRKNFIGLAKINYEKIAIEKNTNDILVIDNLNLHFVEKDLIHELISKYSIKKLTEFEQELVSMFSGSSKFNKKSGCMSTIIVFLILVLIFYLLI